MSGSQHQVFEVQTPKIEEVRLRAWHPYASLHFGGCQRRRLQSEEQHLACFCGNDIAAVLLFKKENPRKRLCSTFGFPSNTAQGYSKKDTYVDSKPLIDLGGRFVLQGKHWQVSFARWFATIRLHLFLAKPETGGRANRLRSNKGAVPFVPCRECEVVSFDWGGHILNEPTRDGSVRDHFLIPRLLNIWSGTRTLPRRNGEMAGC